MFLRNIHLVVLHFKTHKQIAWRHLVEITDTENNKYNILIINDHG